jgi:hypothetical protein
VLFPLAAGEGALIDEILRKLSEWFTENCNGEWEHSAGIKFNTTDNPRWIMRVTLRGTRYQNAPFAPIKIDKGEHDWIECYVKEYILLGQVICLWWLQLSSFF